MVRGSCSSNKRGHWEPSNQRFKVKRARMSTYNPGPIGGLIPPAARAFLRVRVFYYYCLFIVCFVFCPPPDYFAAYFYYCDDDVVVGNN